MENWITYFVGFFLITVSQDLGVPKEHRPKMISYYGILKMVLVIVGIYLVIESKAI